MTPEGWLDGTLSSLVDIVNEHCDPTTTDERPYIALEHLAQGEPRLLGWDRAGNATSTKAVFRVGDLLFGKLRPNLKKAVTAPFAGVCSTDILVLRPKAAGARDFVRHIAHWGPLREHAISTASGTKMPRTSWYLIAPFEFAIPPLPEQRKIAAILSSVDDAIESTQAVIDQLGVVKKAMMAELLTRGLPGRHTKFKQTEIGEVPETWDVRPLASLVAEDSTVTYGVVQPGIEEPGGVLLVRSGDVAARHLTPSSLRTISLEVSAQFARTVLRGGELLVALVGQPGAVVVAPESLAGANIARQVGLVRLSNRVGVEFVRLYLESESGRRGLLKETLGSVQQVINLRDLEKVLIAVPSVEEQAKIVANLCGIEGRVKAEIELLAELRTVKSALMSVLLTGELRVTPEPAP